MDCASDRQPVQLPFKNVSLPYLGPHAQARGVSVALGTPPQYFSLDITVFSNHTELWQTVPGGISCGDLLGIACDAFVGGSFDNFNSSTFVFTTYSEWNDTDHNPSSVDNDADEITGLQTYFLETLCVAENITLVNFPATLNTPVYTYSGSVQASLGLGTDSAFLNAMAASRAAPSSMWSLWTGSISTDKSIDGLLMIGGYDEARVAGDFKMFQSYAYCPLFLNVTAVSYQDGNHSVSLQDPSEGPFFACMDPSYHKIQLGNLALERFINATDGFYVFNKTSDYLLYPSENPPTGSLNITLSNGYATIIPASEIFSIVQMWSDEGQLVLDKGGQVLAEVSTPGAIVLPYDGVFGIPFMTMNYIIVDYDNGVYEMAPANRSEFPEQGKALKPKAVCRSTKSTPTSYYLGQTTTQATAPSTTSTAALVTNFKPQDVDTTAIVGSLVGIAFGANLFSLALLLLLRWRHRITKRSSRRRSQAEPLQPLMSESPENKEGESAEQEIKEIKQRAQTF